MLVSKPKQASLRSLGVPRVDLLVNKDSLASFDETDVCLQRTQRGKSWMTSLNAAVPSKSAVGDQHVKMTCFTGHGQYVSNVSLCLAHPI